MATYSDHDQRQLDIASGAASDARLIRHAYRLLVQNQEMVADARRGAAGGNTVIGAVMAMTLRQPRQFTEAAVRDALAQLDRQAGLTAPDD